MFINRQLKKISFGLLGPEELKRSSVCEVTTTELYTKNNDPKFGGLFDPRMGPCDKNILCKTCKHNMDRCTGHFGHIELHHPVYNPHFLDNTKKVLSCVCHICSQILLTESEKEQVMKRKTGKRFQYLLKMLSKNKKKGKIAFTCYNCNRAQPKYSKEGLSINKQTSDTKTSLDALDALEILKNISDEDIVILGMNPQFSRPEWLICQVMPVPPPCVRPSVKHGTNTRSEDDLVYKLIEIIKSNHLLVKATNKDHIDVYIQALQYHVATMIDNDITGVPKSNQRSGRPLKSIKERIKGKEGRIRSNLMGKRVNFSARSVVSPDPSISITELGVPFAVCMKLTFPEVANYYNFKKLEQLIINGPLKHPGANFVIKKRGEDEIRMDLRYARGEIELRYGDIVERHLDTGDIVLFNRQPSLHKMSMCGHRVVPMKGKSFRLNPSVCNPYNADFDGDEMNIFLPRTEIAKAEIGNIACVEEQIIAPQSNGPIIGSIMDVVLGSSKMTQKDKLIDENTVCHVVSRMPNFKGELPEPAHIDENGIKHYKGRDLMSMMLPNINYYKSNDEEDIEIKNGKLISGTFDKGVVGAKAGSLVHLTTNDINTGETRIFLDTLQRTIINWMKFEGFSIGFGDAVSSPEVNAQVDEVLRAATGSVNNFLSMTYEKKMKMTKETFENKIFNILNKARDQAGSIVMKNLDEDNAFFALVNSGAKGNNINISQIMGCVGQQNVQTKGKQGRVTSNINNRSLPLFTQYNNKPEAKGFVASSYMKGLDPSEFFFHSQSGREGIIDTACKTATTGYIQRKMMKLLEDLNVKYDLTVRSETNNIVQFAYGGDNFDPKKVEKQKFEIVGGNNDEFKTRYSWTHDQMYVFQNDVKVDMKLLKKEFNELKKLRSKFRALGFYKDDDVYMPINIHRIVKQTVKLFDIKSTDQSDLTPKYLFKQIDYLMKNIKLNCDVEYPYNEMNDYNLRVMRALIKSKMSSKVLIFENHITKEAFDHIVKIVMKRFYEALIHPGESVGSIAAQSLGEPCTQLTLNTFHMAGVASKSNVNSGVPRFKELISVSKNLATPSMTVYMNKHTKTESLKTVNKIENTKTMYFVESTSIFYDNDIKNSCIEEDREFVREHYEFDDEFNVETLSPWVLRIKMDPLYLINKEVSMLDIYISLMKKYQKKKIQIIFSDENSENIVFHFRFIHSDIDAKDEDGEYMTNKDYKNLKKLEEEIINSNILDGINKIKKVTMRETRESKLKKNGSIEQSKEIVLDTSGTNLQDLMMMFNINKTKTFSNDIHETNELLGIEAARELLKQEIVGVFGGSGIYVNDKHLALLCDLMTSKGILISIDRHGVAKTDMGPITKASFEEPHDHFVKASMFNTTDHVKSLSANLIAGQTGKFGTGIVDIVFDIEKLTKHAFKNKIMKTQKRKVIKLSD